MNKAAYYKKCDKCSQSYASSYFSRHICTLQAETVDEIQQQNLDTEGFSNNSVEEDLPDNEPPLEVVNDLPEAEDDLSDSDTESVDDDIFDEIFLEAFLEDSDDSVTNSSYNQLVKWLCLFLAHWQRSFNVTDNALEFLIKFLVVFFTIFIKETQENTNSFVSTLPRTLYSFRKLLSVDKSCYKKYAVCLKCHHIYDVNICTTRFGGQVESKKCTFKKFPNHSLRHLRKECGQPLMKKVTSPAGKEIFIPHKIYCYKPLENSLKSLLERPSFEQDCEQWRSFTNDTDVLTDVYDGEIWKTFSFNNEPFFSKIRNYGLMLNTDWFQPFKHLSSFSIGAIYLVLLNLPRNIRFRRENVILVGIIPDMPKEPPTNTFIHPLVEELEVAWNHGFFMKSLVTGKEEIYRLALICVGCDIPASRKICGFLSHSAMRGCSRCNKLFPGGIGERDYSGFDIANWEKRTTVQHRQQMIEIRSCNTLQDKSKLESKYGTRFSVLALLPYFDTIRMTIVDPMHNLFLGSAKHILKIWKDLGYLTKNNLEKLQEKTDQFVIPHDIGKIPRKIVSSFDGFNADEYKNWTLLFAIFALDSIIPPADKECLRKFVIACNYLCRKTLSKNDVQIAHGFLLQFCKSIERLYGKERVTPNMHLHMHLKECVLDFGPIYGFWLFSFERYNGMLGMLPTNKKMIEPQIMRRFCSESVILNLEKPPLYKHEFIDIFQKLEQMNGQRGTLHDTESGNILISKLSSRASNVSLQPWFKYNYIIKPLSRIHVQGLSLFEKEKLKSVYTFLYPNLDLTEVLFQESIEKTLEICIAGNRYGSESSRNSRSAYVVAFWTKSLGEIAGYGEQDLKPRPGVVKYFFKHSFIIDTKCYEHWFAFCEWFFPVADNIKNKFGKPVEVWYNNLFEQFGPASYIPALRIMTKFVHAPYKYQSKDLMIVVPRITHSS